LGGMPVAYYGFDNPYSKVPEVTFVRTIRGLLEAGTQHLNTMHMGQ
jgi:hypothetical protein